ncbi:MAG: hypothetical protein Q7T73_01680 [Beijerinckiaceae bacterium]|nr:hypothetical protein [Beijerinckiaceae bacterium]
MARSAGNSFTINYVLFGFIAGFLAVPLFHQLASYGLFLAVPGRNFPWSMRPNAYGVPGLLNLAFWGGVWGILFAFVQTRFPRGVTYFILAFLFGAILPTAFSWYVLQPMRGRGVGAFSIYGPLLNGAWGLGTGIIYMLLNRRR